MIPSKLYPLLLLVCTIPAMAQLPGMKTYGPLDGYPGTIGYVIHQDSKGFIWIGTDNGATCFDGKKFKVFDNNSGLTDKEIIMAVPGDRDEVLLTPLLNNLSYYKEGKVITAAENPELKEVKNTSMNRAQQDPVTRQVWIDDGSSFNRIYRFTADTMEEIKLKNIKDNFAVIKIINNTLILGSLREDRAFTRIISYDLATHTYRYFTENNDSVFKRIGRIACSNDGRYFAAQYPFRKEMKVYKVEGQRLTAIGTYFCDPRSIDMIFDQYNRLWVLPEKKGVYYWGPVDQLHEESLGIYLFPQVIINCVFTDRDHNIWLTTSHKGLFFISAAHWQNALLMQKLQMEEEALQNISSDERHRIWLGYYFRTALKSIDPKHAVFLELEEHFPRGVVRIQPFDNGQLCVAIVRDLYLINHSGKDPPVPVETTGAIKDIAVYKDHRLLVATHADAALIDFSGSKYTMRTIFKGRSSSIESLPDGSILIGTPNGLFRKKEPASSAQRVGDKLLASLNITDIIKTANDHVLVSTNARGLYSYNYVTGRVRPVEVSPTAITAREIYRENDSIYWLATDKGACRLLMDEEGASKKSVTNYTFFDGLPSSHIWSIYVQKDTAFIATAAGLGIIPLKAVASEPKPPITYITSLHVDDSTIYFPTQAVFSHSQNDIQFSLSAISYESIGNVRYTYQLEGLSNKWVETESPELSFTGLSPGEYLLKVYAINFKGVKSSRPVELAIIIRPAFWQTWWFKATLGLLIASAIFVVVHREILRRKFKLYERSQQKRRLAELELEAIKAQINPHFIYNCLNSIQYFNYKQAYAQANQYLDLFATLIRQTMQYSQETFISLAKETDYLSNYLRLEKMRFKEKLNYNIEIGKEAGENFLLPAMLVQPYVENALKHGIAQNPGQGELSVAFNTTKEGWMNVTISDNGPGFENRNGKSANGHLGLRLSASRAETYNQLFQLGIRVSIHNGKENPDGLPGTMVSILIPPISYENTKM